MFIEQITVSRELLVQLFCRSTCPHHAYLVPPRAGSLFLFLIFQKSWARSCDREWLTIKSANFMLIQEPSHLLSASVPINFSCSGKVRHLSQTIYEKVILLAKNMVN